MNKLISSVFKIIIGFMLLMLFGSLTLGLIDAFTTIDRVQSIAAYAQTDLAKNNCITYGGYTAYKAQLQDVSNKSTVLKAVGCYAGSTGYPISAYLVSTSGDVSTTKNYVQYTSNSALFNVANQGDILELRINTKINLRVFLFGNDSGEVGATDTSVDNFGWSNWGRRDLVFKYRVPALRYLK